MHHVNHTWYLLIWVCSAAVLVYLALSIGVSGRLPGPQKRRANRAFWLIVALAAIRVSVRFVFGFGLVYRFAVVFVGIASGTAALILIKDVITAKAGSGVGKRKLTADS